MCRRFASYHSVAFESRGRIMPMQAWSGNRRELSSSRPPGSCLRCPHVGQTSMDQPSPHCDTPIHTHTNYMTLTAAQHTAQRISTIVSIPRTACSTVRMTHRMTTGPKLCWKLHPGWLLRAGGGPQCWRPRVRTGSTRLRTPSRGRGCSRCVRTRANLAYASMGASAHLYPSGHQNTVCACLLAAVQGALNGSSIPLLVRSMMTAPFSSCSCVLKETAASGIGLYREACSEH